MKKLILTFAASALLLTTFSQPFYGGEKSGKHKHMKHGKKHECTAACQNGEHAYKHGEKGHTCTDTCHKKM